MPNTFDADIISLQREMEKINGTPDIETGFVNHSGTWPEPTRPEDSETVVPIDLVDHSQNDLLTKYATSISESIQFPITTVFLHGLGCVAAAMNKSFTVDYFGVMPVNLYVVTAQPPSAGKSGVNNYLSIPIRLAYQELNKKNKKVIVKCEAKLKELKALLKDCSNDHEQNDLLNDWQQTEEELSEHPIYKSLITNATPEALESCAFAQRGIFNVVSDEAGAVNSILGLSYGEKGRPSNCDMVLQGWDGNYFSSLRVTRGANEGIVKGSISVIAQMETVLAILRMGERGNGLSERFLLCSEQNVLGSRNHLEYKRVDDELRGSYNKLIHNIVMAGDIEMKLSDEAKQYLRMKMQELEPELGDYGKYATNMLRGFVGKMPKQVVKIACVLHAVDNFVDSIGGVTVEKKTIQRAYSIYSEVTKLYVHAADSEGFAGTNAQIKDCYEYMQKNIEKSRFTVRVQTMLDTLKSKPSWKNQIKRVSHFRAVIMPKLAKMNSCAYTDDCNSININPKL